MRHLYVMGVNQRDGALTVASDDLRADSTPIGPNPVESQVTTGDLYSEHHDELLRLAYLLTANRAVAEDIVHDAFFQVHRRQVGLRSPRAYLRASVVNGCRMHHRRHSREQARLGVLLPVTIQSESPFVLDALDALPHRQRTALVLRYYADLPDDEIADLLQCRQSTVRSHVRRGLAALRKAMDE